MFWSVMIGMSCAPLIVGAIEAAPAFFKWLGPALKSFWEAHKAGIGIAVALMLFILELIIDHALTRQDAEKMMEAHSPGTCVDFFAFIKNYCDEWDLKVLCITPNDDDTLTVLAVPQH